MITYYNGDLLKSKCDIIAHQVNLDGIFGSGLAKQIAEKYPQCEYGCQKFVKLFSYKELLGKCYYYKYCNTFIFNCFTQNLEFYTVYNSILECFQYIYTFCIEHNYKTIGIPKNYGCGIATGNWDKVEEIFKNIFENDNKIELQIWDIKGEY